jgi:hypothetical protein
MPLLYNLVCFAVEPIAVLDRSDTGRPVKNFRLLTLLKRQRLTIATAIAFGISAQDVCATVRYVKNCGNDFTPGTLGYEIIHADSGDTIDLTNLTCGRITGVYSVNFKDLNLVGPGRDALVIDGQLDNRVFSIYGVGTRFSASELTITRGADRSDDASGACISSQGHVELTNVAVINCIASGQSRGVGGGISATSLSLVRSVVSGNLVYGKIAFGGGIAVFGGDLVMHDTLVNDNEVRMAPTATRDGFGGGVAVGSNYERAEITGSTISGNHAATSAGMSFQSSMPYLSSVVMVNSTVSGNKAERHTGGIYSMMSTSIYASTIAFNTATSIKEADGDNAYVGLHIAGAPAHISDTIISNNSIGNRLSDFSMSGTHPALRSEFNIITSSNVQSLSGTISFDPMLQPLAFNGGPTPTHALPAGSPAIDAGGWPGIASLFDQRGDGFSRHVGYEDIGAYEYQGDSIFSNGFD